MRKLFAATVSCLVLCVYSACVCGKKLVKNLNNLFICYVAVAACRHRIRAQTRISNANLISFRRVYQIVICLPELNFLLNANCVLVAIFILSLHFFLCRLWAEQTNLSTNLFAQPRGAGEQKQIASSTSVSGGAAAAKRQTIFIIYLLRLQLCRKCHKRLLNDRRRGA